MNRRAELTVGLVLVLLAAARAGGQDAPHHRQARQFFERVIGFRSAAGHGQVPEMARYIAETLRAGGVPAADIVTLPHEETVALLVRIPGRVGSARPILFSAHMDVVDARPEDWVLNPFALVEKDGYFFGRGTIDNKAGVVSLMSTILRMRSEGFHAARTLVFAFVGDEETGMATTKLVAAHDWVRNAEFAINTDAGGGELREDGRPMYYLVQGAEKTYVDFRLTVRNPGGHSSWPRVDNAIYDLARALTRLEQHRFPVMANALTRSYLGTLGTVVSGKTGEALRRFAANPEDQEAVEVLWRTPEHVGTTRTTCIATMLDAGHAPNALPQRAMANVNCRIFPGHSLDSVRASLVRAIGDSTIAVEASGTPEVSPVSEPRADVMEAIARSIHARHPGIPITPYLESGGTDGRVYRTAGIPTFASSGLFYKSSDMFAHGLNERVPVKGFYGAIDHVYELARALGGR